MKQPISKSSIKTFTAGFSALGVLPLGHLTALAGDLLLMIYDLGWRCGREQS
jgi:hypothetical protein